MLKSKNQVTLFVNQLQEFLELSSMNMVKRRLYMPKCDFFILCQSSQHISFSHTPGTLFWDQLRWPLSCVYFSISYSLCVGNAELHVNLELLSTLQTS